MIHELGLLWVQTAELHDLLRLDLVIAARIVREVLAPYPHAGPKRERHRHGLAVLAGRFVVGIDRHAAHLRAEHAIGIKHWIAGAVEGVEVFDLPGLVGQPGRDPRLDRGEIADQQ